MLTIGGLLFALLVPLQHDSVPVSAALPAGLFMLGIGLVLVMQAERRRSDLHRTIALELNKLRRIYHIAKNLSHFNQDFRPWFTELHGHLYGYLMTFNDKNFGQYEETNPGFRKVSYHVYTIPDFKDGREAALYQDLLNTTGEVARARQRIKEIMDNRLSAYGWVVFLIFVGGFVASTWFTLADTLAPRVIGGVVISLSLILVDLLWQVDSLSSEYKVLSGRYVENIGRLELSRSRR